MYNIPPSVNTRLDLMANKGYPSSVFTDYNYYTCIYTTQKITTHDGVYYNYRHTHIPLLPHYSSVTTLWFFCIHLPYQNHAKPSVIAMAACCEFVS